MVAVVAEIFEEWGVGMDACFCTYGFHILSCISCTQTGKMFSLWEKRERKSESSRSNGGALSVRMVLINKKKYENKTHLSPVVAVIPSFFFCYFFRRAAGAGATVCTDSIQKPFPPNGLIDLIKNCENFTLFIKNLSALPPSLLKYMQNASPYATDIITGMMLLYVITS